MAYQANGYNAGQWAAQRFIGSRPAHSVKLIPTTQKEAPERLNVHADDRIPPFQQEHDRDA